MSENIETLEFDITQDPSESDVDTSETTTVSDDESQEVEEETTASKKTEKKKDNKSNFKKLAKANKEKDRKIAELEAKLAEKDSGNDEEIEEEDDNDEVLYDKVDLLEFITDTEGAAQYKEQIKEALEEFPGISFEKAFQFAKAQTPTESQSYKAFDTKSSQTSKKKQLKDLTAEEAMNANLTPEQFDAWSNSQKKTVNPFG